MHVNAKSVHAFVLMQGEGCPLTNLADEACDLCKGSANILASSETGTE